MDQIKRDFPSYDAWLADFKASGIAARGWVWLAYDHDLSCLTTVAGDAQNTFPLWNATPVLALDVYEEEGDLFFEDRSDEIIDDDVFARLLTFPNVLITAHQAFLTREALAAIAETTLDNVLTVVAGGASPNEL
mgnify:CR=1 FL=1